MTAETSSTPAPVNSLDLQLHRQQSLAQLRNSLRWGQQQMADWQGGPLAVSAVPGAGKSTGMAGAAAFAIDRYQLHARRQLVLVTFTRSAAANLKQKIRRDLQAAHLPQNAFVVHTLHGLALNIATRHPDLSGLNWERLTLVSPNQNHRLIRSCVEQWISDNPRLYQTLLEGQQFDGEDAERLRRQSVLRTEVLPDLADTVIREAKSSGLTPPQLRELAAGTEDTYGVLTLAAGLYDHYQTLLRTRDLIDYDDMILAALQVLKNPNACETWQRQVFAVFEDEAQDSTPLQTQLLEILATDPDHPGAPNLVRVGDPNQAVNSTFTPADPVFFHRFCEACQGQARLVTMDQAGRSTPIIMNAANRLLDWVNAHVPGQTFRPQIIRPVDFDDPQANANPASEGRGLELHTPEDVYQSLELIGQRVLELFTQNPTANAAVLVRENKQGRFVAQNLAYLQEHNIHVYDVSQRERYSQIPLEMLTLLQFIDRPHSPDYLKAALTVLTERQLIPSQDLNAIAPSPEQFLYPGPLDPPQSEVVHQARRFCTNLIRARLELPYYQLISFLALALQYEQTELATADKLAERVTHQILREGQFQQYAPAMTALLNVLGEIVSSEKFEPVETEDAASRYARAHQLTIITMHKAKGLDWDYVFIPFLQATTIPGSLRIPPQAQFLGDFTLPEVARAQIRASLHDEFPLPGITAAWNRAGQLKTAEEYRLLYVAMTRAKRLLWMSAAHKAPYTWNKPENLEEKPPCPAFGALQAWLQQNSQS